MVFVKRNKQNKNVLALALISALVSVLFSFVGAPFMRALFVSTKSRVFWTTAIVLVVGLLLSGLVHNKISETAVYVGAIWMTLGSYSELEKRGVNWRNASILSLIAGMIFALAGYFMILKQLTTTDTLTEMVEPLREVMNKAFPEKAMEASSLVKYLPGIFIASLFGALATSFAFESNVTRMFKLQRERVASGLRWLEFRLPDIVIWLTLIALLVLGLDLKYEFAKTLSINFLIVAAAALLFQGISVIEFMIRYYRLGLFTRTLTYVLIVLQLTPFVVLVGAVDYWADFRKRVRRKTKTA